MKRLIFVFFIALIGSAFFTGPAISGPYSGLWVGTATLKYVSELNKQYSDLSFDLGLVGVKAHDILINKGASWQYNDSGDQSAGMQGSGSAPLGYGRPEVVTSLTSQPSVFFQRSFQVDDRSRYSGLRIRLWRDDGIVVSLNGEEVLRNNLPAVSSSSTFALSEVTDDTFVEFTVPATLLTDGTNLLEAEVRQAEGSTDLLFDLELAAHLEDPQSTELIAMESVGWRYIDTGADPGNTWPEISYSDTDWSEGQGQFGYGENDENTMVSDSAPTVYFRRRFSGDAADFTHLRILLLRDDGAVVYVNGTEILRSNMPTGTIESSTAPVKALGSADEGLYIVVDVEAPALNSGTDANVLAVELHQHPAELGGQTGTAQGALTRTSAPLDLRLLFHVDGGDQVRLLKEVIQVYDSNAGKYVLLTDHTLVPNYTGVAIRDGVPVGRRLSAVGFDFAGTYLPCTGVLSPSGTVSCTFTLASGHATNPFLHRYHPDHDNLDERYEDSKEEAYGVTRTITLDFSGRYPQDEDLPEREVKPAGWGNTLLGGYYTETVTGLHKEAITVHGPFILRKVVNTDTLTP